MIKNISKIFIGFILVIAAGCTNPSGEDIDSKAFDTLITAMDNNDRWVGIHAAEFLISLSYKEKVKEYFLKKLENYVDTPQYRIGIWRVLALASDVNDEKNKWINNIIRVYKDTAQTDRLHAAESLAKLNINLSATAKDQSEADLINGDASMKSYVNWSCCVSPNPDSINMDRLITMLYSTDKTERRIGAYALGFTPVIPAEKWNDIVKVGEDEPLGSISKVYLLKAAYLTAPGSPENAEVVDKIKQNLILTGMSDQKADRYQLCTALAEKGNEEDISVLSDILIGKKQLTGNLPVSETPNAIDKFYDHPYNVDIRSAAAYAILRIHQRIERKLSFLDWLVISIYATGMIAVGLYYSRKNVSPDDYHLGGRKMNSYLVGLSFFATFISALAYLAYPGEMIRYGPLFFAGMLAFPVIYYVTGWFLIPRFMKLNMTNAYEILELKIGHGVRIMGTVFFFSLRLLWMATIIYAIVTVVFQTIFVFDPKFVPLFSVLLAGITVIYTSFGGIRAVVLTDSIQTMIMLFGALVLIVIVSFNLGSLSDIFPSKYPAHWQEFDWNIDPTKRMTIGNIFVMYSLWFICTAGSDQMAIQRYLGTKDIRAARKSFGINLITNFFSKILLALVGLALLAYFTRFPYKLAEGTQVIENADTLFPRFVLIGLPVGITGLIVAAILAAGMSSLSSGLLSSTTIISGDLINYLNKKVKTIKNKRLVTFVRNPRNTSIILGLLVTILTLFVGYVEGNLLAVVNKVANLLVAPLFVLFFMALFIPFATQRATLIAGICSLAVAVAVSFFEIFGIQFLWIIPFALIIGIVVGVFLSAADTYLLNGKRTRPGS